MAKRALEIELREETEYLQRCDTLLEVVNDNYDVRGSLLSKLTMQCLDQNGSYQRAGASNTTGISKRRFSTSSKVTPRPFLQKPTESPTTNRPATVAIEWPVADPLPCPPQTLCTDRQIKRIRQI